MLTRAQIEETVSHFMVERREDLAKCITQLLGQLDAITNLHSSAVSERDYKTHERNETLRLNVQQAQSEQISVVGNSNPLFSEACDRIFDMLLADDGEAYSLAERFIKQHRPDLYNRMGLGTDRIAATGKGST